MSVFLLVGVAPRADAVQQGRLLVVAMPRAQAEIILASHPAGVGLGVYPESRDPLRFIREIGSGAPRGRGSAAELGGEPGRLGRALVDVGVDVRIASGGSPALLNAVAFALSPDPAHPTTTDRGSALRGRVVGLAVLTAAELEPLIAEGGELSSAIVLGVGNETPLVVGVLGVPILDSPDRRRGLILTNGIAHRPGIVTPYDVTTTLIHAAGAAEPNSGLPPLGRKIRAPSSRFIGERLDFEAPHERTALDEVHRLEARLVRDATFFNTLGATTVVLAIGALVIAGVLLFVGLKEFAARVARGSWFVAAGYPAALFVPSGRAEVRIIVVVAALLTGGMLPLRMPLRVYARIVFAAAILFAALVAVAPLHPGGEPGLSIWGNPLVSWRFFGLQNAVAAVIGGGIVVWGVLARLPAALFAAIALLIAVVIGTPEIGANFVGVLTFVFGATLAVLALVRKRVTVWHVLIAGVLAVAAFSGALADDAVSPTSHGGRAAQRISEGGVSAAYGFVKARVRLNIDLIRGFFGGVAFVAMVLAVIVALVVWGARATDAAPRARAAVWAGAAMALASLLLEDSGFYSGATLVLAPATAWIILSATDALTSPTSDPGG